VKQIVLVISIVLSVAALSHATETQDQEKDLCLLGITNKCTSTTTLDLVDKIARLEAAINKGSAVYTPEELKHLQAMLEEAYLIKELLLNKR